MANNKEKRFCTSIGGQAVLEGVMMRSPKSTATSIRKADGEIVTKTEETKSISQKVKFLKLPIIRGCVAFIESMIIGTKALMLSAEYFDIEDEEESTSKFDLWVEKVFGEKLKGFVIGFSIIISLFFSIGLFILIPAFITSLLKIQSNSVKTLVEGGIKLLIFFAYLVGVSKLKDIRRVFEYHGAEHKTIHCYESGDELTVENAKKHSRLHPRCGTSFLFIVLIISIVLFLAVPNSASLSWGSRALYKIILLPIVAGFAYEAIKFTGKHTNTLTKIISAPGMALQYITTSEPDDKQLEVAIAALNAVKPPERELAAW
ncbi:MAG: DUF1385 domain-containing protein [Firmicutes bacterium]|nr:DUF1385 domain-containing protein [Bacillota bacterium]